MSIELVSPYGAAKVINGWLEMDGINKKLPPQMVYSYVSKGYIKSVEMPEGAKCRRMITGDQLKEWYDRYVGKTVEEVVEVEETIENLEVDGVPIDDEQTVLFEA